MGFFRRVPPQRGGSSSAASPRERHGRRRCKLEGGEVHSLGAGGVVGGSCGGGGGVGGNTGATGATATGAGGGVTAAGDFSSALPRRASRAALIFRAFFSLSVISTRGLICSERT